MSESGLEDYDDLDLEDIEEEDPDLYERLALPEWEEEWEAEEEEEDEPEGTVTVVAVDPNCEPVSYLALPPTGFIRSERYGSAEAPSVRVTTRTVFQFDDFPVSAGGILHLALAVTGGYASLEVRAWRPPDMGGDCGGLALSNRAAWRPNELTFDGVLDFEAAPEIRELTGVLARDRSGGARRGLVIELDANIPDEAEAAAELNVVFSIWVEPTS